MRAVTGCPCRGYQATAGAAGADCTCGHAWGTHDAFRNCLGAVPYEPAKTDKPLSARGPAEEPDMISIRTRVACQLDAWTRGIRHAVVVYVCRALRHPAEDVKYSNGSTVTRCPCHYIEFSGRSFAA